MQDPLTASSQVHAHVNSDSRQRRVSYPTVTEARSQPFDSQVYLRIATHSTRGSAGFQYQYEC
jgi:hypothetical protein